jgi:sugar lactone lactonase YvrE
MNEYDAFPVFRKIPPSYHLESPVVADDRLLWVEIHGTPEPGSPGLVHYIDIPSGGFSEDGLDLDVHTIAMDEPIGAVMPTTLKNKVVIAKERTFHILDLEEEDIDVASLPQLATVIDDNPLVRLNDCRPGFDGRIYAGTMAYDCETPLGKWGPVSGNEFTPFIENVKVSNGFGWTEIKDEDGREYRDLVYVDSKSGKVDTHDDEFNGITESSDIYLYRHYLDTDSLGEQQILCNITPVVERQVNGCPVVADGGCIAFDDGGNAFFVVAEYNGAAAHIFDLSNGEIIAQINIPALKITSCCWVGDYLVFTSTREGIADLDAYVLPEDRQERLAGSGNLFWAKIDGLHGREPYKVNL